MAAAPPLSTMPRSRFHQNHEVLLAHGADPRTRDDNGLTPLDWVERAAKSVDRETVRRMLL